MVRSTNCFIILFAIFWQGKAVFIKQFYQLHGKFLFAGIVTFIVTISPQLLYWHYTTGYFLHYSYGTCTFDFAHPKVWKGLFSYRKGLFIYTPITLFGFIGLVPLWYLSKLRFIVLPYLLFFGLSFFVTFSWFMWFYGGSFGCRVYIEMYIIMSIPICALLHFILNKNKMVQTSFFSICLLLIALNLFQTWQYRFAIMHYGYMDKKYYWHIFGKIKLTEEDRKIINTSQSNDD